MKITLRQMEIFSAIARHENISLAAQQLSLSQSAASSALLELERQFDCPLFDRIGRNVRLNATGKSLLPKVLDVLSRTAEIESLLSGEQFGALSIGASLTIGNYLATLLVADYLKSFPDSHVDLKVRNTAQVIQGVLNYETDLGLIEGESQHPDLIVTPWLEDELVVFCHPSHAWANQTLTDHQQLAKATWILREPGSGTRAQFDQTIGKAIQRVHIQLQLEHTEAIKRAVESGLGIGCLSRLSLRDAFRRGSLCEIATPQFDLSRHFYLLRHCLRHISSASRAFESLLTDFSAKYFHDGQIDLPPIA